MAQQHHHESTPFEPKTFPITVLCDGMQSPANIGALFRTCEAFGITELIFCGTQVDLTSSRLKRTARNTYDHVSYRMEDSPVEVLKQLKCEGVEPVALELTKSSMPLEQFKPVKGNPMVLVIGSESKGISEELLGLCSTHLHIRMFGINSSMNVIQATSIALYSLTKLL